MSNAVVPTPARQLEGLTLDGGWKVLELLDRPPGATGGFFSKAIESSPRGEKKLF